METHSNLVGVLALAKTACRLIQPYRYLCEMPRNQQPGICQVASCVYRTYLEAGGRHFMGTLSGIKSSKLVRQVAGAGTIAPREQLYDA